MTKNKKYLLSLGLIATAMAPVMTVVACGGETTTPMSDEKSIEKAIASFKQNMGTSVFSSKTTAQFGGAGETTKTHDLASLKADFGLPTTFTYNDFGTKITKTNNGTTSAVNGQANQLKRNVTFTFSKGTADVKTAEITFITSSDATEAADGAIVSTIAATINSKLDGMYIASTLTKTQMLALTSGAITAAELSTKLGVAAFSGINFNGATATLTVDTTEGFEEIGAGIQLFARLTIEKGNATKQLMIVLKSSELTDAAMGVYYANLAANKFNEYSITGMNLLSSAISTDGLLNFDQLIGANNVYLKKADNNDLNFVDVTPSTGKKLDDELATLVTTFGLETAFLKAKQNYAQGGTSVELKVAVDYKGKVYESTKTFKMFKDAVEADVNFVANLYETLISGSSEDSLASITNQATLETALAASGSLDNPLLRSGTIWNTIKNPAQAAPVVHTFVSNTNNTLTFTTAFAKGTGTGASTFDTITKTIVKSYTAA